MTRLALTLAAACPAALVLPSAAAALIQVDRGISGVRLDITRAALGWPASRRSGDTSSAASSSGGFAAASACCFRAGGA